MAERRHKTLAPHHGMGRIQFEPSDAAGRGFVPIGVDLAFRRDMNASTFLVPNTLVRLQARPGSTGGLALVTVGGLPPGEPGITQYARTHARGLELDVGGTEKVRIAGVDRWVAFTIVRTHRGHLATGWALFPSLVEGEAVVAVAWSEEDRGPEAVVDAYNDELGSLLLSFEARIRLANARAIVRMDSRGSIRLVSVEGDASASRCVEEQIVRADLTLGSRSDVDFARRLRQELAL